MRRSLKLFCTLAAVMLVVGVLANAGVAQSLKSLEPQGPEAIGESDTPYTLGINDVVEIEVRNQPEFSGQYVVGPDGNIQYAYIGDVKAEGLTKYELKDIISEKLERYVRGAEITVRILAYRSKFIYMLGELGAPGKYPMKGDRVDLREAIFAAGLPTRAAAVRRVHVITPSKNKPTFRKVDIYKLLYQGKMKWNVDLAPGDVVVVPTTIPSELNRALSNLLSPFSQAASSAAIYEQLAR